MTPYVEPLTPPPDPLRCCERFEGLPYRIFLDSARRGAPLGRYSFLTADPVAVIRSARGASADALQAARDWLEPYRATAIPDLPPFQGGAAGYLAYDWGRTLERLPALKYEDLGIPDVLLGIYDWVIAWDHDADAAWLISTGLPERLPDARARRARERAAEVTKWLQQQQSAVGSRHSSVVSRPPRAVAPSFPVVDGWWDPRLELRSTFTHAGYLEAVERVREYVHAGDVFQVNLSQRFEARLSGAPWPLYRRVRELSAAPFAAFLDFPEAVVLSASPERFLRIDVGGAVETRPIKGTLPRGVGPEHDAALGAALLESEKDRAENLMIVDLMRNDLSRVCSPGTVRVRELFALEHYATVHHLVSTVVGTLAPGSDALDLLRAAFPGGSITGAPKVRAMEIIAELEACERGIYCGAIGYWSVTGALDTNIAIRTALVLGSSVRFGAGGGIIADSDPEREYRETLDKARGMIDALAASI